MYDVKFSNACENAEFAERVQQYATEIAALVPPPAPVTVQVLDGNPYEDQHKGAWATTYPVYARPNKRKLVQVFASEFTPDKLGPLLAGNNNFMPAGRLGDIVQYVLWHEWGHVIDPASEDRETLARRWKERQMTPLERLLCGVKPEHFDCPVAFSLSEYGRTSLVEGYAEAFAEWHHSAGKTPNPAARWYAERYGWLYAG